MSPKNKIKLNILRKKLDKIDHKLLKDYPDCAKTLDKYRINPGNVGFKNHAERTAGRTKHHQRAPK